MTLLFQNFSHDTSVSEDTISIIIIIVFMAFHVFFTGSSGGSSCDILSAQLLPAGSFASSLAGTCPVDGACEQWSHAARIGAGGVGVLKAPEDVVHRLKSGAVYTGCEEGWVRRVILSESAEWAVEELINTGGRLLGLAVGNNEIIVADAYKKKV